MDRTVRAAVAAALIGLVAVGGIALVLGIPAVASLITGVVAAALFGGLILAAAKRSEGFEERRDDRR